MRINKSLITYQPASGAGSGTVTSVALSAPTGFTVSGSPVTTSGTLTLAFTTGYGIPPLMTGNSGKFLTTNGTTMSWANIAGTDVTGAALTEVDDTNVTCTLGGTPATSLLRAVSLTFGWAGTLAVGRGGSGASTLTGVLIGNGTSAFTGVAGTASQLLRRNSGNTAYEFFSGGNLTSSNDTNIQITLGGTPTGSMINAVSLTMGWTGQLAVGRGGTGAATLTGVVIGNGTANMTAVAGTAGQFLRRNTANTAYEFRTLQGGDIAGSELTKTDDTNVTLTLGGTPASALLQPVSLTMGWTGQLAVGRGGTGASTLTGVLIGNGTSAVSGVTGTSGQLLRRNVANTAYEFFTASLISGNGVADRVAKWTSATNLVDGVMIDNGTNVGVGITPAHKLDVGGNIGINGGVVLASSGNYHVLYDKNAVPGVYIGNTTSPENIYANTAHSFTNKNGTATYATFASGAMDFNGVLSAGNTSSPNGSIILQDNYSSGHLSNIGSMYSTGGLMLGYCVTPSTSSATAFVSATGLTDFPRSSIVLGENVSIYTGAAQTVAIGSSVTMSERLRLLNSGQLRLLNYTSTSSFSGLTVGLLGFTSTGAITTYSIPGGVSGTQDYLAKFDSTGIAVGNSRIVDNGTNFLLNSASSYVTGLNLIGDIGIQSASGQASSILMRSNQTPTSGTSIGIIDSYAITTGSTYTLSAGIDFRASQNWNSTSAGTNIFVQTAPDNTIAPADMFVFLNNGAVRFIGRTSNPIGAAAGTMYYNSSANNMRYYNGTSWITF